MKCYCSAMLQSQSSLQSLMAIASPEAVPPAEKQAPPRPAAGILAEAQSLVGGELDRVLARVDALIAPTPSPGREAMAHLLAAGGKRLRPLLTLLCARAVTADFEHDGQGRRQARAAAVAAELVHNATLLHDDVIDDGLQRRGRQAPRVIWGNGISVLGGDLLFVTALEEATAKAAPGVGAELIGTVSAMVQGEILQLRHRGRFDLDRATYDRIVSLKTAALFRWCARAGARAGGGEAAVCAALGRFGHHLGVAFQVRDDLLDLVGDAEHTGKALAADLREGKLTLPFILALERDQGLLPALHEANGLADPPVSLLTRIRRGVVDSGALADAQALLSQERRQAQDALGLLPPSKERNLLAEVAALLDLRDH